MQPRRPYREPEVRQIGPVMWKPKPKPEDGLSGYALERWRDEAEIRAILMQEFPDFFDKVVELAEAEAHYQTVKNLKKKDPPTFYEGRNRLYRARQAVDKWGDLFDDPDRRHRMRIQEIEDMIRKRRWQAEENAFYEPKTFRAWVRKQVNDHFRAKRHPERVVGGVSPSATLEIAIRYQAYTELWRVLKEEGVEAATKLYRHYTRPLLNHCRAEWSSSVWHEYPDGNEGLKDFCQFELRDELRFK